MKKLGLFVSGLHKELALEETTVYKGVIDPNRFGDIKLLPFVVNAKIDAPVGAPQQGDAKGTPMPRQKAEEVAGKLVSLRDSGLPEEYLYLVEDKAGDVLNVSENLKDLEKKDEEKGFGYKLKLFFGLAKKAEQEEIKRLEESKSKLASSIESLSTLSDEVPGDVAKALLKEQVESLRQQQAEINALIEAKEKKAKGLFSAFG